ncbi:putative pentatricopeptide repeat-containing protein [Tanacetum coccineum]
MVVIWNLTLRKYVGIVIPISIVDYRTIVNFGVFCDTSDPKLVKINTINRRPSYWVVDVFSLSTRVWKTAYRGAPFKSCHLAWLYVFVDGVIYFRAYEDVYLDRGSRFNFVISFDLKSEKFSEVCVLERLVHTHHLDVAKVNESLGLLKYYDECDMMVCSVWMRNDGANKKFSKIYTIKVDGISFFGVLGFRNNSEVVIKVDDDNYEESRIEAYKPLSGHIIDVGINGKRRGFYARSYMETLLFLD